MKSNAESNVKQIQYLKDKKEKFCILCGEIKQTYRADEFILTNKNLFQGIGYYPFCKACRKKLFQYYIDEYTKQEYFEPDRAALKRFCMIFNMYYSDKIFDSLKEKVSGQELVASCVSIQNLKQHRLRDFDTTIFEEKVAFDRSRINKVSDVEKEIKKSNYTFTKETVEFFGEGFPKDDYEFLKKQYEDWTARHECKTKAQEEIFKNLCFKQLDILKARREGKDTDKLDKAFQDYLNAAKLQPKQNSSEAVAENQTFGTLIEKWEETRPIPEVDEELKDVDNIALYTDVFYRGHMAKFAGFKNAVSDIYTNYMKKYTVEKPEYNDEEDTEILFDNVFGNQDME